MEESNIDLSSLILRINRNGQRVDMENMPDLYRSEITCNDMVIKPNSDTPEIPDGVSGMLQHMQVSTSNDELRKAYYKAKNLPFNE
jgi:hypothetical protein